MTTVVKTVPGREHWLADCVASIPDAVDVIVVRNDGWEPGALLWMLHHTTVERFLFLQDSCTVTASLYDLLDAYNGDVSINNCPSTFGSYLGVYTRAGLASCPPRPSRDLEDDIAQELQWGRAYGLATGAPVLFPDLHDRNGVAVERHGQRRLMLTNEHFTKYKGVWR